VSVSSLHPSALTPLMSSTILTCVAQGILLVYDVTDRGSFNSIRNWVGQIQQVNPSSSSITVLCIIFIIKIFTHLPDFFHFPTRPYF
jgi:L-lactate permease